MLRGIAKLRTQSISGIEENYDVGLIDIYCLKGCGDYFTFKFLSSWKWILVTKMAMGIDYQSSLLQLLEFG